MYIILNKNFVFVTYKNVSIESTMNNYLKNMEISKIVNSQKHFFNTNKTKDVRFRIETLKKLKTILKENEKDLYNSIYSDFKKSEFETYMSELALIYNELNDAIRNLKKWSKQKKRKNQILNPILKTAVAVRKRKKRKKLQWKQKKRRKNQIPNPILILQIQAKMKK